MAPRWWARPCVGRRLKVIARAAAAVGDALASLLLAAARRAGPPGERDRARAAVADEPAGRDTCFSLGLPALGAWLAHHGDGAGMGAAAAVAQRLPPEAGRRLLAGAGMDARWGG